MGRLHLPLSLLLLSSLATAIPTSSLFTRQDTDTNICPAAQSACPSSLPTGFCCRTDDRCIALAGNTTVLCCPKDNKDDCDRINPITCNLEQQSPEKNPLAPIKTSVFDVELETCGEGTCCPFGFSCEDGKICRMNEDQEKKPGEKDEPSSTKPGTSDPTSSTTQPSATDAQESESPSSLPSDEEQNDGSGEAKSSGPDTTTIIGGVVGGIAALLAIAIILFICARRRASRKLPPSSNNNSNSPPQDPSRPPGGHTRNFSSSSGPRGNNISEPIMQQNSYRTDFILKNPATASVASTPQIRNSVHPHISTVRDYDDQNPFRSPNPSHRDSVISTDDRPSSRSSRLAPIRGMRGPRTPRQQDSCESINVFADPGTVERQQHHSNRFSMGTTVSGLMIGLRGDPVPASKPNYSGSNRLNVPGTTPRI
ncbi:hypothetical protein CC79DRAFT_1318554 [Sarocladium strictum]